MRCHHAVRVLALGRVTAFVSLHRGPACIPERLERRQRAGQAAATFCSGHGRATRVGSRASITDAGVNEYRTELLHGSRRRIWSNVTGRVEVEPTLNGAGRGSQAAGTATTSAPAIRTRAQGASGHPPIRSSVDM
jgi:hypothetical protein